jgi:cation:H+ antiporter
MNLLYLLLALLGLWVGTELAVRQALRIAQSLGLSPMFVGLTILSIGTDLPEWVLSIEAGIQRLAGVETSGLTIGNAIGSSLGQIGFVLGVTGLVGYVTLGKQQAWRDGVMLLGSIVLFWLVGMDGEITRIDGGVLLTVYLIYFATAIRGERSKDSKREPRSAASWTRVGALCVLGFAIIAASSHVVITSAVALAQEWGIDQTFVGIVLIGIGTSLPELAVSINAVLKKAGALSVGNIIGSNIFDVLVVPGTAAAIAGIGVRSPAVFAADLTGLFAISLLALYFFRTRKGIQKREAIALIVAYTAFVALRILWADG